MIGLGAACFVVIFAWLALAMRGLPAGTDWPAIPLAVGAAIWIAILLIGVGLSMLLVGLLINR